MMRWSPGTKILQVLKSKTQINLIVSSIKVSNKMCRLREETMAIRRVLGKKHKEGIKTPLETGDNRMKNIITRN